MAQLDFDPYVLLDALRAGEDVDLIRQSVEFVLQALIEAEATSVIGASAHERSETRSNYRNGHRPRRISERAMSASSNSRRARPVKFPRC